MPAYQPFLISNYEEGVVRNREPFEIPEKAFVDLDNAYVFRGRVLKKNGTKLLGRLVEQQVDTYNNVITPPLAGSYANTLSQAPLSPGSVVIQIKDGANPAVETFNDNGDGTLSGGTGGSTIDYTTGAFTINYSALAGPPPAQYDVVVTYDYFTCRPTMGIMNKETTNINNELLIVFDTVKANLYDSVNLRFIDISFDSGGAPISWTGSDSDFFWGVNYYNFLWVVNFVAADQISKYDGTDFTRVTPSINSSGPDVLKTCRMLFAYKDRLLALNTIENDGVSDTNYFNRARWTWNGDPSDATAWYDNVAGKGDFLDAPTNEAIISAEFIRDTLIVYFERSTYRLNYTNNPILPFVWEKIDTEFGAESTFSKVAFDKGVFAVGKNAITTCNGTNVDRIDLKIPDEVFKFHNDAEGPKRVHGIRDFFNELVYWTFPAASTDKTYPDRLLVLNYREGTYSFFNDSFTALGQYQKARDQFWVGTRIPWQGMNRTWEAPSNQSQFPTIIGGNQQGFISEINSDQIRNDPTLYISGITTAFNATVTVPNHNLEEDDYVLFVNVEGMTEINNQIGKIVNVVDSDNFQVDIDASGFTPYTGAGTLIRIDNFNLLTKRFNPFFQEASKIRIGYVDLFIGASEQGEFNVSIYTDENDSVQIPDNWNGNQSFTVSTQSTETFLQITPQEKIWTRVFVNSRAQFIQLQFNFSDSQMRSIGDFGSPISLHSMILHVAKGGRIL